MTVDSKGGGAMGSALFVVVVGWWCTQEVARRRNQMGKVEAATACDAGRSGHGVRCREVKGGSRSLREATGDGGRDGSAPGDLGGGGSGWRCIRM